MKYNISILNNERMEYIIHTLCREIKSRLKPQIFTEYMLRRELIACILASQVRYEMALNALNGIEQEGLLVDKWWTSDNNDFESRIYNVLTGKSFSVANGGCYRFSKTKTYQIVQARNIVISKPLSGYLYDHELVPKKIRERLINDFPGIGPKHASMFLRNIGLSYNLAILDTHVIKFMRMQNLLAYDHTIINTLQAYEKVELCFSIYADSLGYPVGYLDWAIWVVMRAIKELNL